MDRPGKSQKSGGMGEGEVLDTRSMEFVIPKFLKSVMLGDSVGALEGFQTLIKWCVRIGFISPSLAQVIDTHLDEASMPDTMQYWVKAIKPKLADLVLGGASGVKAVSKDVTGDSALEIWHHCTKVQEAGLNVYENLADIRDLCADCGALERDSQLGSKECPWAVFWPMLVGDMGDVPRLNMWYRVDRGGDPTERIDSLIDPILSILQEKAMLNNAPWKTMKERRIDMERFRRENPIGKAIEAILMEEVRKVSRIMVQSMGGIAPPVDSLRYSMEEF